MVRINNSTTSTDYQEIEKKLSKMESKIKKSRRRLFSCFNCLIYLLVIIALLVGLVTYALAKSGLKEVPYLTDWLFVAPTPVYKVTPQDTQSANRGLIETIKAEAAANFFLGGGQKSTATFDYTEEYLTGWLIEQVIDEESQVQELQVAITGDQLELYLYKLPKTYLLAQLELEFDAEKRDLDFTLKDLKLGNLNLPKSIGNLILNIFVGHRLSELDTLLGSFGEITDIQLIEGALRIKLTL